MFSKCLGQNRVRDTLIDARFNKIRDQDQVN